MRLPGHGDEALHGDIDDLVDDTFAGDLHDALADLDHRSAGPGETDGGS